MGADYTEYAAGKFALNVNVVGGTNNATHVIQSSTVTGANTTDVTFSNLSINTDLTYQLWCTIHNPTGVDVDYQIFFNGDNTVTDYFSEIGRFFNGTNASGNSNTPKAIEDIIPGESAIATIDIMIDAQSMARWFSKINKNTVADLTAMLIAGYLTVVVADITSITIHGTAANSIGIGSKFILYGSSPI